MKNRNPPVPPFVNSRFSTSEKVVLFRRRFRGRTDIYPIRWESAKGKSGYSPACANKWRPGVCHKPRVKCGSRENRLFRPITDEVVHDHLVGSHTIDVYPLLADDRCWFLAAGFDTASSGNSRC